MKARGNLLGLRPSVIRVIEKLYERRVGHDVFVEPSFALALHDASIMAGRRIGVAADRRGVVLQVIVGDATTIETPSCVQRRIGPARLSGVRLVYTTNKGHTIEELERMRMYSLDASIAVLLGPKGHVPLVEIAYLLPMNESGRMWEVLPSTHVTAVSLSFDQTIHDIETQMRRDLDLLLKVEKTSDAALVVLPVFDRRCDVEWELSELEALCRTAGVAVAGKVVQRRDRPDPRTLIGRGKLREITMTALHKGVDLLVFGSSLTPSQQRSLAVDSGVRVIDRNQLILSIFARHARTNEGKLQVELAQLRYNFPRLSERDDSMSRLTGGIGATGPGETKLEMERRRARERIHALESKIAAISKERAQRRKRRDAVPVPMVAIVGYTNAGKSTLFNLMTNSNVDARDQLFATLDPTVRRVQPVSGSGFLLCDTVGFIRDLPKELIGAFRATIEEIATASALLLVADASDPHVEEQIAAVRRILAELDLAGLPYLLVLNKADLVEDRDDLALRAASLDAIVTSAREPESIRAALNAIGRMLARSQLPSRQ